MNFSQLLSQAGRMTTRDWRAGELRLLAAALVIAVAAVTSVGFFVDRIRLGLERDAGQLLGGDLVVISDGPVAADIVERATADRLAGAQTVAFPSMAISGKDADKSVLSSIKAVSAGYPLRGVLRLKDAPQSEDAPARGIPAPGTVWIDPQLALALQLNTGDTLRLGDASFRIDKLISIEPDRGAGFVNFAPRVMLNVADLPSTQLVQPGSRVTYRLLVAGDAAQVRNFSQWLDPKLQRGQRIESLENGRPEMQRTVERAERFLSLVALLAAMIAAVAVAAAARRFSLRHLDSCAMMRCLGLAQAEIFQLFSLEFIFVGIAACVVGVALGYAFHFALLAVLGSLIQTQLPQPSLLPATQGFATGLVLLLGFALPPLVQLRAVPPLRVLRKDVGLPTGRAALGYLVGFAGFFALLVWSANDLKTGSITAGGFAAALLLFALVAWGVLALLQPLRAMTGQLGISWRFAIAAVQRRPIATIVQLVALAVGLMALLLLTITRGDLVSAWRSAAPPDAPNRFVINIQPDQVPAVRSQLKAADIDATLNPMIRGRLVRINEKDVGPSTYDDERAKRLVDREFNLSYTDVAPEKGAVVQGQWFKPSGDEVSMEEGIAKTLGVRLGDELSFDIAGQSVSGRVTSLRKVNWDSMRANFFVLMPTRLLANQPQTFITAFHVEPRNAGVTNALLRDMPNISVIDTSALLAQVQAVLDQVTAAVEFLFLFTLAAGVLVLYAALASSRDERVREAALLRALGASRQQLQRAQVAEMLCLGGLAGLLAAIGASAIGWSLATYAFEFEYRFAPWVFIAGIVAGAACATLGGWMGLRGVLNTPPLQSLREA